MNASGTIFPNELIAFANELADSYWIISEGEYFSENKQFHIIITSDFSPPTNCPIRVSNKTGNIEISKRRFTKDKYSSDFLFMMILWCVARVKNIPRSDIDADNIAIDYYKATTRSVRNILVGYTNLLSDAYTADRLKRIDNVFQKFNSK